MNTCRSRQLGDATCQYCVGVPSDTFQAFVIQWAESNGRTPGVDGADLLDVEHPRHADPRHLTGTGASSAFEATWWMVKRSWIPTARAADSACSKLA